MNLTEEWKEDQGKGLKIAGRIELELTILTIKERSGRNTYKKALFIMVFLLPSFLAISGHSLREDISLSLHVAMFGAAVFLFAKGYTEMRGAQKDLSTFLKECVEQQDPDVEIALSIVIHRGNFQAWEEQIVEARRKSWKAR
ncbi:MAG: hypothetical protein Q8P71_00970 [bacterium]|nr:hypothetical protein [bacterium]